MKDWFSSAIGDERTLDSVVEMDWGEEVEIPGDDDGETRPPLQIVCVPCQHWCRRTLTDMNKCLWSSWIARWTRHFTLVETQATVETSSSWESSIRQTSLLFYWRRGRRRGKMVPCAQPHVRKGGCAMPHRYPQPKICLGIHWGTFILTGEGLTTPRRKLKEAVAEAGLDDPDEFVTLQHGETMFAEFH